MGYRFGFAILLVVLLVFGVSVLRALRRTRCAEHRKSFVQGCQGCIDHSKAQQVLIEASGSTLIWSIFLGPFIVAALSFVLPR